MDCEVIVKEFDQKAVSYECNRLSEWYKAQGEEVLKGIDPHIKYGHILDVGCGTGWLLRKFLQKFPDFTGVGIDISSAMIEVAAAKARLDSITKIKFLQSNWEKDELRDRGLDFMSNPMTLITCVSAFHYFSNPYAALEKVYKVLKPGGQFLLLDRAKDGFLFTSMWNWLHRFVVRDHVQFYQSAELEQLLEEVGFIDIKISWKTHKYFWKGKLHTSLVLFSGRKPGELL